MSWFAKSIVNSIVGDDDDDENKIKSPSTATAVEGQPSGDGEPGTPNRGVKDDISELTKNLTRQFWGVASFLAPPPSDADPMRDSVAGDADALAAGIRSDLAEIGGKFKSGISMLSQTKAVTGISKIAASFLELGLEGGSEVGGVVGVSDEVVTFVREIAIKEEIWLDFPLVSDHDDDDGDDDDFVMSDVQEDHALAIERLVPRLAALRLDLCPSHMSEARFWKIYFVLLLPRLGMEDAELLSTPQIVEARSLLSLQDSQNMTKAGLDNPKAEASTVKQDVPVIPDKNSRAETGVLTEVTPSQTLSLSVEPPQTLSVEPISVPVTEVETVKHPVQVSEVKVVDKAVIEEPSKLEKGVDLDSKKALSNQLDDEDVDDWLDEDTEEAGIIGNVAAISLEQEEDVSFSDLEDDK